MIFQALRSPPVVKERVAYYDFEDFKNVASKDIPSPWILIANNESTVEYGIILGNNVDRRVIVGKDLSVTIYMQGVQTNVKQSLVKQKLKCLLNLVRDMNVCQGVTSPHLQALASLPSEGCGYYSHITYSTKEGAMTCSSTVRSNMCLGTSGRSLCCPNCHKADGLLRRKHRRRNISSKIHVKTPLDKVGKARLKKALVDNRKKERKLEKELMAIRKKLEKESIPVSNDMHTSLLKVLEDKSIDDQFIRLFWKEQQKAFGTSTGGMRWHPMLLRFAMAIHSQSAAAYRTLRDTGVLKLPGESTLRDYSNAIHPEEGFNDDVIEEVVKACKDLNKNQRWVVLMHDEMAIKADLVLDGPTGDVVGFVNPNLISKRPGEEIANHVLAFMVVGVNSHLKMSLGYFATQTAKAHELYQLFWEAVGVLEVACGLKVIFDKF